VVVFTNEIKDGTLGGLGRILRLPDIYQLVFGGRSPEAAERVLAARRQTRPSCFSPLPASEPCRERPRPPR
jgi:hypothetical protein